MRSTTRLPSLYITFAAQLRMRQRARYSQYPSTHTREAKATSVEYSVLLEKLPKVMEKPRLIPIPISTPSNTCEFIVFDLETTGLAHDSDICQIAAMKADPQVPQGAELIWSTYLLPNRSIDKGAQKATGLSTEYYHGQKHLCVHGVPVEAQPYKEGIQSFYYYLQQQSCRHKHTVLVAYGADKFDVPVLVNSFKRYGISSHDLEGFIAGFADGLHLIQKMRRERHQPLLNDGIPPVSASLSDIYYQLFDTQLKHAHCATADTRALHQILFQSRLNITPSQLLDHSSTVSSAYEVADYTTTYLAHLNSMKGKLFNNSNDPRLSVNRDTASKIARCGLCYDDLAKVYREHGPSGINVLLTSHCNHSSHRVTNDPTVVEAVIEYLRSVEDNTV